MGGGTPSRSVKEYWGGPIPWATVKDFKSTTLDSTSESITRQGVENSATNIVPAGAIIVPTRMAVGKAAISAIDLAINQDLKAILPNENVDRRFLLHFLLSQASFLKSRAQGATVKGIKLDLLRSLPFPRLPIEEQRGIAAIMDKAASIRSKSERALELADNFSKSAYVHMVGHEHPDHESWMPTRLEQLAEHHKGSMRTGPFGSALRHSEFANEGIAVLGIDNAVQNRFAWGERRYITQDKYSELTRYRVLPGDVIITIMGTTGRSAVIPDNIPEAITTKHLAAITCDSKKVLPEFLSFAVHSDPLVIGQIEQANKGAIMQGLNLGIIKKLEINVPPLDAQRDFVRVLKKTTEINNNFSTGLGSGDDLYASISQHVFYGEL